MPIEICPTCNIPRTKYINSIELSDIFQSKYCFFSIRTRGLCCVMRSLVSICAYRANPNLIEIIYVYKKASVMEKFTGELLHRIESKLGSSSYVEANASNVSNIPPDTLFAKFLEPLYMYSRNSSRMESKRIPSFQDKPTISSYDPRM